MIEMTKDFLLDPQTWQNISAIALPAAGAAPDIPTNKKCTANFVGMIEGRYKQVSLDITRNDNYTLSADDSRIALNAIIIAEVAKVILPQPTLECLEDPDSILIDDFWYTTVANDVQSERMWRNTKARNFEQRYFDKKTIDLPATPAGSRAG